MPATGEGGKVDLVMDMETKEKRRISETHSYSCKSVNEGECEFCPNTTQKPVKKHRPNPSQAAGKAVEPTLAEAQENIIRILSANINQRSDQTEDMVKENSKTIMNLGEALNSIHTEMMALQKENECLKNQNEGMKKSIMELEI